MDNKSLTVTGVYASIPGLDTLVANIKSTWIKFKAEMGSGKQQIIDFMTNALDDLIIYMVEVDLPGTDKKAIVLKVMNDLYDYIVAQAIPFWAKPFGRLIKDFMINVLISHAIDWIVSKYKDGVWNRPTQAKIMSLWGVPGGYRPN
jgi:hypothetical protein